jgi:hypothetical protein
MDIMIRATTLLFLLLLAACSDEKPAKEAVNLMIESPIRSKVISSFDHYPPRPVESDDSDSAVTAALRVRIAKTR